MRADLRYAARTLRSSPGFLTVALLVLALGIGATTAVFSILNAVLLRSLPFGNAQRLVYLWTPNSKWKAQNLPDEISPTYADFYDWQRLSHSFSSMATLDHKSYNLLAGGGVKRISVARVTGGFFHTLEVVPERGRAITAPDDQGGHEHVAVISDRLWREVFGGEPGVIGQPLHLNRETYTVIGVASKDFVFPHEGDIPATMAGVTETDVWIPLALSAKDKSDRVNLPSGDAAIGRLKPGISVAQAQSELVAIESHLDPLYPEQWRGWTPLVRPVVASIIGPVEKMMWLLLGAVGLVLLIACGNVANLLLARAAGRMHEMGIRAALGAARSRLVRQMMTESVLLSSMGGALGILLAAAVVRVLVLLDPGGIPRFNQASVDWRVLGVAVALSLITGILSAWAPALAASRASAGELIKEGGNRGTVRGANRWRSSLIVAEVALSVVLLAGAGLLIRSYLNVTAVNPGFSRSTLTLKLALDDQYKTPQQRDAFYRRFLEKLRALPGVENAGAVNVIPLDHSGSISTVDIEGLGKLKGMTDDRSITTGYLEAMGIPLLAGRRFNDADFAGRTAAVLVNESFVKAYLHGRRPLGQRIRTGADWIPIVGVVGDLHGEALEQKPLPELFAPYSQGFGNAVSFAIRSKLPGSALIPGVRAVLHQLDPTLAVEDVHTMQERVFEANSRRRFQTLVLTWFAGLAVFLAVVGLYGVMAYSVKQRTAEIGVRMALGSSAGRTLAMVLRQGVGLIAIGLVAGTAVAVVVTRLIQAWLYNVTPADPLTFVGVGVLLLFFGGCACLIPAIHAMHIEPVQALRHE